MEIEELCEEFDKLGKQLDALTVLIEKHPGARSYQLQFDAVFEKQAKITNQIADILKDNE